MDSNTEMFLCPEKHFTKFCAKKTKIICARQYMMQAHGGTRADPDPAWWRWTQGICLTSSRWIWISACLMYCCERTTSGFICEENPSPKCQTPSNLSICPLKSVTMTNCSQVETPMRMTSMQMSFPETVSDSLCSFFGYANRLLQQLSGCLVLDDLGGEVSGCGGPGLVWLHVVCGCEAGWMCNNHSV